MTDPSASSPSATQPEAPAPRPSWRRAWAPGILLLIALSAYAAYWMVVRQQAQAILVTQAEALRADGYRVEWGGVATSGFPMRVTLTLADVAVAAPSGREAWSWSAQAVRVHALPYDLRHVIIEPTGEQTVRTPDGGFYALSSEGVRASVRADGHGLTRASLVAGPTKARDLVASTPAGSAEAVAIHLRRDPDNRERYRAYAGIDAPAWPGAGEDAPEIVRADGFVDHAQIFAEHGAVDARAVSAWSRAGGAVQFNAIRVQWPDSAVETSGALKLDEAARPEGTLSLRAETPARAFSHLAGLGLVEPADARRAALLAGAMTDSDGVVAVPITIDNGDVRFLGIRLGRIDPLF